MQNLKKLRNNYTSDELKTLLNEVIGTKLEIPVMIDCFYGFRRSEVIGLKWSAIDFENKTITINHTITQGYISQVIKKDERYIIHKEEKHQKSLEKKAIYNKEYYKTYERPKKDDDSYKQLQAQLDKDTAELSSAGGYISNYDYAKWNPNTYEGDKNGDLKLVKGLKVGRAYRIPKRNVIYYLTNQN